MRISANYLRTFVADVFSRDGIHEKSAVQAADVLCTADEWGISSHGVARLRAYHDMILHGRINPLPRIRVVRETPATSVVDGDNGLGLIVGLEANQMALERAEKMGVAWVSVMNSNHFGIAGYYAIRGLDRDLIGIAMTNTPALVSPLGVKGRVLGTNPIAAAFPAHHEPPVVIDMSTSAVSLGFVENARRDCRSLPQGCIVTANGEQSVDPNHFFEGGSLLPLGGVQQTGGHKGYCLATFVDLLCGVLPGAAWGPFVPPFPVHLDQPTRDVGRGIGHTFTAVWTGAFTEPQLFRQRMDDWIRTVRSSTPADGSPGPLIPGDPERRAAMESRSLGVALAPAVFNDLAALARELNLKLG
jgi:L-2-hydroxycarboxylate dehydrogenase (NAD+)